jgi:hypothetical protein
VDTAYALAGLANAKVALHDLIPCAHPLASPCAGIGCAEYLDLGVSLLGLTRYGLEFHLADAAACLLACLVADAVSGAAEYTKSRRLSNILNPLMCRSRHSFGGIL